MRVAPRELRAVRRDGLLVRFAMLGPVAYVEVEVPPEGSAAAPRTPSLDEGWGFVLRGSATLHAPPSASFPPERRSTSRPTTATGPRPPRSVIAGFVPVSARC